MDKSLLKRLAGLAKNMLLRVLAAFLSTGVRQFLVLPILAATFDGEKYGAILTINSVASIIEVCLGNTLNNARLVMKSKYENQNLVGDFSNLLFASLIASSVATVAVVLYFRDFTLLESFLIWAVIILGTLNAYFIVHYVMTLHFNQMLIHSAWVAAGTIIGALITRITHVWPFAFLTGNACGLVYITITCPLVREPMRWTSLWKETLRRWLFLIATALLSNSLIYLDRLLLYPILGGDAVANYTTASFFGKCVTALMPSIANVLLGYYVQKDFIMTRKRYLLINSTSVGVCIVAFLVSIPFAPILNKLFFPELYESSLPYVIIANLATITGAAATLAQSMILRYCKTSLLLIIQVVYGIVYFGGGMLVLSTHGLLGFCFVALFANLIKVIIMVVTGYFKVSQIKSKQSEELA